MGGKVFELSLLGWRVSLSESGDCVGENTPVSFRWFPGNELSTAALTSAFEASERISNTAAKTVAVGFITKRCLEKIAVTSC